MAATQAAAQAVSRERRALPSVLARGSLWRLGWAAVVSALLWVGVAWALG